MSRASMFLALLGLHAGRVLAAADLEALPPVIDPPGPLVPGDRGTITFSMRNNGPEPIPSLRGYTNGWAYGEIELAQASFDPQCSTVIDQPGDNAFSSTQLFFLPSSPLLPGAIVSCRVGFYIPPRSAGPLRLSLTAEPGTNAPVDTNPANDTTAITVAVIDARSVDVLTTTGVIALLFGIFAGLRATRRPTIRAALALRRAP